MAYWTLIFVPFANEWNIDGAFPGPSTHMVLAIRRLAIGVLTHLRRVFPEVVRLCSSLVIVEDVVEVSVASEEFILVRFSVRIGVCLAGT